MNTSKPRHRKSTAFRTGVATGATGLLIAGASLCGIGMSANAAVPTTIHANDSDITNIVNAFNASSGSTVILDTDISTTIGLDVLPGRSLVLDLNGHNLDAAGGSISRPDIFVHNGATLAVKGKGTLTAAGKPWSGFTSIGNTNDSPETTSLIFESTHVVAGGINAGSVKISGSDVESTTTNFADAISGTSVEIVESTVKASGTADGIGAQNVAITGSTVTAEGREFGISAGSTIDDLHLTVENSTVTATGQEVGIGQFYDRSGSSFLHFNSGTITATATDAEDSDGAGIYGSSDGTGELYIGPDARLTASGANGTAIASDGSYDFMNLANLGTLNIPDHSSIELSAYNTGHATNSGTIRGGGTIANGAAIVNTGTVDVSVTKNSYRVTFDANGGSSSPAEMDVFAPNFGRAEEYLPAAPSRAGYSFTGWFTDADSTDEPVTTSTSLGAGDGPTDVTLYAGWEAAAGVTPPATEPVVAPPAAEPTAPPAVTPPIAEPTVASPSAPAQQAAATKPTVKPFEARTGLEKRADVAPGILGIAALLLAAIGGLFVAVTRRRKPTTK